MGWKTEKIEALEQELLETRTLLEQEVRNLNALLSLKEEKLKEWESKYNRKKESEELLKARLDEIERSDMFERLRKRVLDLEFLDSAAVILSSMKNWFASLSKTLVSRTDGIKLLKILLEIFKTDDEKVIVKSYNLKKDSDAVFDDVNFELSLNLEDLSQRLEKSIVYLKSGPETVKYVYEFTINGRKKIHAHIDVFQRFKVFVDPEYAEAFLKNTSLRTLAEMEGVKTHRNFLLMFR